MNLFSLFFKTDSPLAAPASSFVRHRNYDYASSQELLAGTHRNELRHIKKEEA